VWVTPRYRYDPEFLLIHQFIDKYSVSSGTGTVWLGWAVEYFTHSVDITPG